MKRGGENISWRPTCGHQCVTVAASLISPFVITGIEQTVVQLWGGRLSQYTQRLQDVCGKMFSCEFACYGTDSGLTLVIPYLEASVAYSVSHRRFTQGIFLLHILKSVSEFCRAHDTGKNLSYLSLFNMAKRLRMSSTVTSKNSSGRLSRSLKWPDITESGW